MSVVEEKYTWVDAHVELAKRLLDYQNRSPELISILQKVGISGFTDKDLDGNEFQLDEIDPFTFFCYIYKHGSTKRLKFLQEICREFGIDSVPIDDSGIPSANAQKVWLFPYSPARVNDDVNRLWKFFHLALNSQIDDVSYAQVLEIKNTGPAKLTEGLFYIAPERYLPINRQTKPYLKEQLKIDPKFTSFSEYLALLDRISKQTNEPFYQISFEAWKWNNLRPPSRKYWRIGTTTNGQSMWSEMFDDDVIAIGWSSIGDLSSVARKSDVSRLLAVNKYYQEDPGILTRKAGEIFDFRSVISEGDIAVAQDGDQVLGIGIVNGDYVYNSKSTFAHQKGVDWVMSNPGFTSNKGRNTSVYELTNPDLIEKIESFLKADIQMEKNDDRNNSVPLNQILYGPPGTGKTRNSIVRSVAILDNKSDKLVESEDWAKVKSRFDQYVKQGRIVFTTFHQSFSYEDFIEGLKPIEPKVEGGEVIYRVVPGVLKSISKVARENFELSHDENDIHDGVEPSFEIVFDKLIADVEDAKLTGTAVRVPLTETYCEIFDVIGNSIKMRTSTGGERNGMAKDTLKAIYESPDNLEKIILGGMRTYYRGLVNKLIEYSKGLKNKQAAPSRQRYVLVIDEINRGNVSQIFGELITLIEDDKRLGKEGYLEIKLPYSKETLTIPPNLFIVGTMNTADRSVEALDTALRRRFSFVEMPPKYDLPELDTTILDYHIPSILERINKRLEKLLTKDHLIGHSFFLRVDSSTKLKAVFQNKVIPLLQEYFYGDFGKIGLVLGGGFFEMQDESTDEDLFADFGDYDIDLLTQKPVYKLKNVALMDDDHFKDALRLLMKK